ncbi:hypothetical protein MVLG_04068 [Microbotryum lychnidis-dioicae p1A1 Lamole]|uniref:Cytochrome b5 heme-binding domain-containing protein n=2 Tax=Microbotryum TaxID=34416 RepID=U5HA33_USTV1|nr:hypothetical protein MVLG_04068 [Microbotryum lychnidis-dioicae p1A1 Lamole]SGY16305.1 BQ5605_C012g06838 [Microbotryum silenes-dioicae]|eukprot:KDE05573.1 hypothetical protein MVLG_04068 [Microbotryum lychnidis-dioicae p1A1 Lamole]
MSSFLQQASPVTQNLSNLSHPVQRTLARLADNFNAWLVDHQLFVAIQIVVLSGLFFWYITLPVEPTPIPDLSDVDPGTKMAAAVKPFSTDDIKLDPPKDDPITVEELKQYDGTHADKGIYVAIKGTVFDVSAKKDMYGPGCGYHIFTGKDASCALGKSSLKIEDADPDYSKLNEEEMKVLDDWFKYFAKRYNIVGKVVQ